ncbi:MAG: bifunctional demethylmenaquinone methyltransferase/2-methoxy-6-polyprenyl-1,4-benzoquinol methylase UbiE [Dehalococcoidia bacterium]
MGALRRRGEDRAAYVRALFTGVADSYDLLNSLLSLGRDRAWRRFTASRAAVGPGVLALDVATGTAELARHLARQNGGSTVVGIDFCPGMLEKARTKLDASSDGKGIELVLGDVLQLPFPENTFDCVTIGFGLRNVADIIVALQEMARVVKPGGKVVSLELTRPSSSLARAVHTFCLFRIVPHFGWLISGSREAYTYLPESIMGFPSPVEVQEIMQKAGIQKVETYSLTFGIATVHAGIKEN